MCATRDPRRSGAGGSLTKCLARLKASLVQGCATGSAGRRTRRVTGRVAMAAVVTIVCIASLRCGGNGPAGPTPGQTSLPPVLPGPSVPPAPAPPHVFVGAGDIAFCDNNSAITASLADAAGGTVFTLGDHAYPAGTRQDFRDCYEPTWGTPEEPHAPRARQSRIPFRRRAAVLRLLRTERRPCRLGLLQLLAWRLARHRPEQQYPRGRRVRAGGMAPGGVGDHDVELHTRILASPPVHVGTEPGQSEDARLLADSS